MSAIRVRGEFNANKNAITSVNGNKSGHRKDTKKSNMLQIGCVLLNSMLLCGGVWRRTLHRNIPNAFGETQHSARRIAQNTEALVV